MRKGILYDHAFANGEVFGKPSGIWIWDWLKHRHNDTLREVRKLWSTFESRSFLGNGVKLGLNSRMVNLSSPGNVMIGDRTVIRGIIRNESGGRIRIGADVYLGDCSIISCLSLVEIGEYSLIAHGVQIFDNDTHPMDAMQRQLHFDSIRGMTPASIFNIATRPVIIGKHVWVGMNSMIMKGVTIGNETVIAAGSVVTHDLPANVIASGNPAKAIKSLNSV